MPDKLMAKRIDGQAGMYRLHLSTCKVLARSPYRGQEVRRRAQDGSLVFVGYPMVLWPRSVGKPCRSCKASADLASDDAGAEA